MMPSPSATLLAHIDIEPRLLASLIVLGLCLVIWFFKVMLSSPAKPQTAGPTCPTCGGKASWALPENYWKCFRCNRPVPIPGQQPPMGMGGPPPPQNPYGAPPPQNPYGAPPQNPYAQPPPMQQQAPQVPFCGMCGGPGRWISESNAWGCDRCRQLIQPR